MALALGRLGAKGGALALIKNRQQMMHYSKRSQNLFIYEKLQKPRFCLLIGAHFKVCSPFLAKGVVNAPTANCKDQQQWPVSDHNPFVGPKTKHARAGPELLHSQPGPVADRGKVKVLAQGGAKKPGLKPSRNRPWARLMAIKFLKNTQPAKFCLLHINKTKNNTHCVVSNLFGKQKTLWAISGGQIKSGHKANGRRKTRYVQRMVYASAIAKILALGFDYLVIHCKGMIASKHYIFKAFSSSLKIILLKDLTGVAHNGCRPAKMRRV